MDGLSFGIGQSMGHRIFGGIFGSSTPHSSQKSNPSNSSNSSNPSNPSNSSDISNTIDSVKYPTIQSVHPNIEPNLNPNCKIPYDEYLECIKNTNSDIHCENFKKLLTDCEKSKYDL
jgi:hypothetical protein